MPRYAGLTNNPDRRKKEHGNPHDWWHRSFSNEAEARMWEKEMLRQGYTGGTGGDGWRHGYTYTINRSTNQ